LDGILISSVSLNFTSSQVINWAAKNGNEKLLKKIIDAGGSDTYHRYKASIQDQNVEEEEFPPSLLTNTPLMWAAGNGFLRAIWLLLMDGYSPNDTDSMGNNCLHLAASSGHTKVLQILVDDGANPFVPNLYKNRPIDVASNQQCRDILINAMERYSSLDADSIIALHDKNLVDVCVSFFPACLISNV
jgi:ankyrin repeat protein